MKKPYIVQIAKNNPHNFDDGRWAFEAGEQLPATASEAFRRGYATEKKLCRRARSLWGGSMRGVFAM